MSDTATTDPQTATTPAPVTEIPAFKDENGVYKRLRPKDFPRTRDGRKALFEFRAQVYEFLAAENRKKITDLDKSDDPAYNKQRKIERLRQQLAKLESEADEA